MATTLLVNAGFAVLTGRIRASGIAEPVYIAWGTGAGTTGASDTTLFTESADESRTAGTSAAATSSATADTWRLTGTMTCASNGKTITNAGCFTASSGGTLFIKGDFNDITLAVGESIAFTVDAVFANA